MTSRSLRTLVLRGEAMDPESKALDARLGSRYGGYSWQSQLADLYASALLGSESVWGTYNDLRTHVDQVKSAYAVEVRQKLDATKDARLLARVGERLTRPFGRPADKAITQVRESAQVLGIQYLQRAVEIDPQSVTARTVLYRTTAQRQMSEADRLANRAHERFMISEDITEYAKKDPATAKKERDDAKRDAERVLEMAEAHPGDAAYSGAVMTAHHVLAALALRDGDRERSIRHLHESVKVPTSEQIQIRAAVFVVGTVQPAPQRGRTGKDRLVPRSVCAANGDGSAAPTG